MNELMTKLFVGQPQLHSPRLGLSITLGTGEKFPVHKETVCNEHCNEQGVDRSMGETGAELL